MGCFMCKCSAIEDVNKNDSFYPINVITSRYHSNVRLQQVGRTISNEPSHNHVSLSNASFDEDKEIKQNGDIDPLLCVANKCSICFELTEPSELFRSSRFCPPSHIFCKTCMSKYVLTCAERANFSIRCPGIDCHAMLHFWQIEGFLDARSLVMFNDFKKSADEREKILRRMRVMLEMESPSKFILAMQELNFKQCPRCFIWIERIEAGCSKMTCRCGCMFCYECGAKNAICDCSRPVIGFYSRATILNNYSGRGPELAKKGNPARRRRKLLGGQMWPDDFHTVRRSDGQSSSRYPDFVHEPLW